MQLAEFEKIAKEDLVGIWGDRAFPRGQLDRLWKLVRGISAADLKFAIDNLAMNVAKTPTIGAIQAACLPAINRAVEVQRQQQVRRLEEQECVNCAGTGWATAYKFEDPHTEFSFICDRCSAPSVRRITGSQGARQWSPAYEAQGFILRRHDGASEAEYREACAAHKANVLARRKLQTKPTMELKHAQEAQPAP